MFYIISIIFIKMTKKDISGRLSLPFLSEEMSQSFFQITGSAITSLVECITTLILFFLFEERIFN